MLSDFVTRNNSLESSLITTSIKTGHLATALLHVVSKECNTYCKISTFGANADLTNISGII